MKNLLDLEEIFLFVPSICLFSQLDHGWGWYALMFSTPDLNLHGSLANPRLSAWTYNLIHYQGLSAVLYIVGYLLSTPCLMFAGTVLLRHSNLDRAFGYGSKHPDTFQDLYLLRGTVL